MSFSRYNSRYHFQWPYCEPHVDTIAVPVGFRMIAGFSYGSMTPELVPPDCLGRWRGLIGFVTGLMSIPAPVVGGYIWERVGPEWVFILVTALDLLVLTPLLYTVPETLDNNVT